MLVYGVAGGVWQLVDKVLGFIVLGLQGRYRLVEDGVAHQRGAGNTQSAATGAVRYRLNVAVLEAKLEGNAVTADEV